MSIAFQCPSCLKTLSYEPGDSSFTTCPYCKGRIMVPSVAVHQAETLAEKPTDYLLVQKRDLRMAEIQKELQAGRKIQAIAMFRKTFGTGLREAKEAVETLQRGQKVDLSRSSLKQYYEKAQEQNQPIYPGMPTGNQQNPSRIAFAVLGALIALGIAIFIMFAGK